MGHRFDVGAFSDQHQSMGMAEVVRAYRAEAGVDGGQVYVPANIVRVLKPPKPFRLIGTKCS